MTKQLHQRLADEQIKLILKSYLLREISSRVATENLGLKHSRFFKLVKLYEEGGEAFTVMPELRTNSHRKISNQIENNILQELKKEKELIENQDIPIRHYNYSAVRDDLVKKFKIRVSVPTIIDRAKKNGFYQEIKKRKIHDREVLTNFAGELVQHDSSHHLWSPFALEKWYLISSLDDYSRTVLFADFFKSETSWNHISAVESVVFSYGCPLKYYPDQQAIFRYVKERDKASAWYTAHKFTDEVDTQFKRVLMDLNIELIYALSPQAKGKVERPYQWLQDRIVRTCAKEHLTEISQAKKVLKDLVYQYNHHWVHSTTKEIPALRLARAVKEGRTLFRPFIIKPPYQSSKDLFCLKEQRVVNGYRKISLNHCEISVPKVMPKQPVELKIIPNVKKGLTEIRIWHQQELVSVQLVKQTDLGLLHF